MKRGTNYLGQPVSPESQLVMAIVLIIISAVCCWFLLKEKPQKKKQEKLTGKQKKNIEKYSAMEKNRGYRHF